MRCGPCGRSVSTLPEVFSMKVPWVWAEYFAAIFGDAAARLAVLIQGGLGQSGTVRGHADGCRQFTDCLGTPEVLNCRSDLRKQREQRLSCHRAFTFRQSKQSIVEPNWATHRTAPKYAD